MRWFIDSFSALFTSLFLHPSRQVNPNSIAAKNGRIREGDRILQVHEHWRSLLRFLCSYSASAPQQHDFISVNYWLNLYKSTIWQYVSYHVHVTCIWADRHVVKWRETTTKISKLEWSFSKSRWVFVPKPEQMFTAASSQITIQLEECKVSTYPCSFWWSGFCTGDKCLLPLTSFDDFLLNVEKTILLQ